jgi:hypothetical protein
MFEKKIRAIKNEKREKYTSKEKKTTQNNTKYLGVEKICLLPHIQRKMQGEIPILKRPKNAKNT